MDGETNGPVQNIYFWGYGGDTETGLGHCKAMTLLLRTV